MVLRALSSDIEQSESEDVETPGVMMEQKQQMSVITLNTKKPEGVMIPGHLWHGTKNIGTETSEIIYFINNLYDYDNPDEERKDFDDPSIINPISQKPFNWNEVN